MRRNFFVNSAVLVSLVAQSASAVDSCPLSNPSYKSLRAAATALEAKVTLPKGCEEIEKRLNDANKQISSSVQSLTTLQPSQTQEGQKYVSSASAAVNQVGQIFDGLGKAGSKCTKALTSMSDYMVAFIDTVNGLVPLLMAFGGSTALPEAMGAMLLGSAVKTFLTYFDGLSVDMSSTQARQAFIENACGYYQLNENLRSLLQTLKGEVSDLEKKVEKLKKDVKDMEASAPTAPEISPRYSEMQKAAESDQKFFADFSATFERVLSAPGLACELVRSQASNSLKGAFPANAISRLESLVRESEAESRAPTAHRSLLESAIAINRPERYDIGAQDPVICANRARDWVRSMAELLGATDSELGLPGRKDLTQTDPGKVRKDWEGKFNKKQEELKSAEERLAFVKSLADQGAEIELSELLDARDKIRRQLFGDGTDTAFFGLMHYQKPAEAWLEHKWDAAGTQLSDYEEMAPYVSKNWVKPHQTRFATPTEKEFACSYAENAVMTWATAEKHAAAARLFCRTFEQTINEASHPYVTEFCLGEFNSDGERSGMGKIQERQNEVRRVWPEIEKILDWMQAAGCSLPQPLKGPLN